MLPFSWLIGGQKKNKMTNDQIQQKIEALQRDIEILTRAVEHLSNIVERQEVVIKKLRQLVPGALLGFD